MHLRAQPSRVYDVDITARSHRGACDGFDTRSPRRASSPTRSSPRKRERNGAPVRRPSRNVVLVRRRMKHLACRMTRAEASRAVAGIRYSDSPAFRTGARGFRAGPRLARAPQAETPDRRQARFIHGMSRFVNRGRDAVARTSSGLKPVVIRMSPGTPIRAPSRGISPAARGRETHGLRPSARVISCE